MKTFGLSLLLVCFLALPGRGEEAFQGFEEFEEEFAPAAEANEKEYDPLSGYNRTMTEFNDWFYVNLLFPVARGYRWAVGKDVRLAIDRFFTNLGYPVRGVNCLLQLKGSHALEETGRFVVNSTVGVLGFFDPAKEWLGMSPHDEDFGQTLGSYGVGGGFHLVIPVLGPSNLRDALSMAVDWKLDPWVYVKERPYNMVDNDLEGWGAKSYDYLNAGSFDIESYESLKKDAVDLYPFFKEVYNQSREKEIGE